MQKKIKEMDACSIPIKSNKKIQLQDGSNHNREILPNVLKAGPEIEAVEANVWSNLVQQLVQSSRTMASSGQYNYLINKF